MRCAAAILAFILCAVPLTGQDAPSKGGGQQPDRVDQTIARATAFLAAQQGKDGEFEQKNQTAMTSLAIMAMAAVGHQPTDESKEGIVLRRALAFVLRPDRQDPNGYFGGPDGSRMYGHGITTLMLAEMLGMGVDSAQDQQIRERLKKAIDLILRAQSVRKDQWHFGGWRYNPDSGDSDLSVTCWQVMALRAAKNAGLDVPKEAIEMAIKYLKVCYSSPRDPEGRPQNLKSACAYQPNQGPQYAMAAAGLLSLQVCGGYDAPEVKASADWLREQKLEYNSQWFLYGTYYYAQGMYQRGGEIAVESRKKVEDALLARQGADGSWQASGGEEFQAGKTYATSMGILCLAVKHHYLPIYQR